MVDLPNCLARAGMGRVFTRQPRAHSGALDTSPVAEPLRPSLRAVIRGSVQCQVARCGSTRHWPSGWDTGLAAVGCGPCRGCTRGKGEGQTTAVSLLRTAPRILFSVDLRDSVLTRAPLRRFGVTSAASPISDPDVSRASAVGYRMVRLGIAFEPLLSFSHPGPTARVERQLSACTTHRRQSRCPVSRVWSSPTPVGRLETRNPAAGSDATYVRDSLGLDAGSNRCGHMGSFGNPEATRAFSQGQPPGNPESQPNPSDTRRQSSE